MPTYLDQTGHKVELQSKPIRIVSLVPSQTELLHDLGLADQIVGASKFCVHPRPWVTNVKKVGGTKTIKHDVIADLQPDLIIGNKEENTKEDIEKLRRDFPVWTSDVNSLTDAMSMMQSLGKVVGVESEAKKMVSQVKMGYSSLRKFQGQKMAYMIWNDPMMVAGNDTYVNDVLRVIGLKNAFIRQPRYPEVSWNQLADQHLDFLFLASEPFPFTKKHIAAFQSRLPKTQIVVVDGEMFSWYGSRMITALEYFEKLKKQLSQS